MEFFRTTVFRLKLTFSLLQMAFLVGISRFREDTLFFFFNAFLTVIASVLLGALLFIHPPAPEKTLPPLPISFENIDSQLSITLSITQEEAELLLKQHEDMASQYRFLPQSYFVNRALLAYQIKDYEKAGQSFRIARYISPNAVFFTE